MSARELDVWCHGELAGRLRDDGRSLTFAYDEAWVAAGRPPLGQALPTSGGLDDHAVRAFFEGLLPEGEIRDHLAARLGVSASNPFSLLEQIGGDCAGAISLYTAGARPPAESGQVSWLSDDEVAQLVLDLPQRPMHADPDGEYRLSLAGAQDKLPVVVRDGRIGLPSGATPSTHILKAPIGRLPATVLNEALWSRVGTLLGIDCARSTPHRIGDVEMLFVERYDRAGGDDGTTVRLHQEDFCQALGVVSDHKYEREQGPGLADCFALLRRASRSPARELPRLLDAWALSFLAANHDAHAKNYALLYRPDGAGLAPVYDVLNTVDYWKVTPMDRKMAMQVGGEYRPGYVRRRHMDRMLHDAGLGPAPSRRRLRALAIDAPAAVASARKELSFSSWDHPHLDKLVNTTAKRSEHLLSILDEPGR